MYDPNDTSTVPPATNPDWPASRPFVAWHSCLARNISNWANFDDAPYYTIDQPAPYDARQRFRSEYFASVSLTDWNIGRMLTELNESKFVNETIVILIADHGWELGESDSFCKMRNSELGTRIPFAIKVPHPDAPKGLATNTLGSSVDLYRTMADLVGLLDQVPKDVDGYSLADSVANPSAESPRTNSFSVFPRAYDLVVPGSFSQCPFGPPEGATPTQHWESFCVDGHFTPSNQFAYMGYAVRNATYRMVRWYEWDRQNLEPFWNKVNATELFDYTGIDMTNFNEFDRDNIADKYPQVVEELEQVLKTQWTKWTGRTPSD